MKDKSIAVHGLDKIPDIVFLREANIEIGKLKSYILELEDKLKTVEETLKLYESNEAKMDAIKLAKSLKKSMAKNQILGNHNGILIKQVFELTKKLENGKNI